MTDPPSSNDWSAAQDATLRRPRHAAGVREYPLGDELLLYAPDREAAHALNLSALVIWEMCDGTRTVDEIGRELAADVARPVDAMRNDVRAVVDELHALGLITFA